MAFVAALDFMIVAISINPPAQVAVAIADTIVAAVAWFGPWRRWAPQWQLVLAAPIIAIITYATLAFDGLAAGTGPYFVLLHAWVGLNFSRWVAWALAPVTAVCYAGSLLSVEQSAETVANAVTIVVAALLVGLLIATQIDAQRRDRDRIAKAERWRAALSATLAHDLRSPLATMQLAVELVRGEDDTMSPTERARLLDNVLRQVDRVNRLAASLLDMERIDANGSLRLDLEQVRLANVLYEAVELVGSAGIAVDVDPALSIEVDRERLLQMLVNLLANARRHGQPPVVVRVEQVPGWVSIEVRDHGPGVADAVRGSLFGRFAAVDADGSVGLGLWIVDQLARAHHGRVRYEPAEPGARLVLMLPTRQPGRVTG
ncbi:hypothetical protein GCM10010201_08360 [Pilimelia columellifera subsp. columellifera]|uniref:histidine kinase n=2 Tax=Pilimelia TaxID=53370 RepID=A0ABP6AFS6_9ACTN